MAQKEDLVRAPTSPTTHDIRDRRLDVKHKPRVYSNLSEGISIGTEVAIPPEKEFAAQPAKQARLPEQLNIDEGNGGLIVEGSSIGGPFHETKFSVENKSTVRIETDPQEQSPQPAKRARTLEKANSAGGSGSVIYTLPIVDTEGQASFAPDRPTDRKNTVARENNAYAPPQPTLQPPAPLVDLASTFDSGFAQSSSGSNEHFVCTKQESWVIGAVLSGSKVFNEKLLSKASTMMGLMRDTWHSTLIADLTIEALKPSLSSLESSCIVEYVYGDSPAYSEVYLYGKALFASMCDVVNSKTFYGIIIIDDVAYVFSSGGLRLIEANRDGTTLIDTPDVLIQSFSIDEGKSMLFGTGISDVFDSSEITKLMDEGFKAPDATCQTVANFVMKKAVEKSQGLGLDGKKDMSVVVLKNRVSPFDVEMFIKEYA